MTERQDVLAEALHAVRTPETLYAALIVLPGQWEEAADRIADRAMFGDPASALSRADALRACAAALRAALEASGGAHQECVHCGMAAGDPSGCPNFCAIPNHAYDAHAARAAATTRQSG